MEKNPPKIEIRTAAQDADLQKKGYMTCIYGPASIGKTTRVATLPQQYWPHVLIVDFEDGVMRALHGYEIPYWPLNLESNLVSAMVMWTKFLEEFPEKQPWNKMGTRYLFINSVSELIKQTEFGLQHARKKKFITLKEYGDAANRFREWLRALKALNRKGIHVIMEAHEDTYPVEVDGSTEKRAMLFPKVGKTLAKEFLHLVDFCAHMEIDSNDKRIFNFQVTNTIAAKRSFRNFPEQMEADYTTLFTTLHNLLHSGAKPINAPLAKPTQQPSSNQPAKTGAVANSKTNQPVMSNKINSKQPVTA